MSVSPVDFSSRLQLAGAWHRGHAETKSPVADVQQFHAREYVPNRTILVVVGDLTGEQASALVQTHSGSWKKGRPCSPNSRSRPHSTADGPVGLRTDTITIIARSYRRQSHQPGPLCDHGHELYSGRRQFSSRLMDLLKPNKAWLTHHEPGRFASHAPARSSSAYRPGLTSRIRPLRVCWRRSDDPRNPGHGSELEAKEILHRRQLSAAHRFERQVGQRPRPGGAVQPWRTALVIPKLSKRSPGRCPPCGKQYLDPQHYAPGRRRVDCENQGQTVSGSLRLAHTQSSPSDLHGFHKSNDR